MTETTIQELTRLRDAAEDDFERKVFTSILACFAATADDRPRADGPGGMERCAECDYLWPVEDLFAFWPEGAPYGPGLCPTCVISAYCEAQTATVRTPVASSQVRARAS